METQHYNIYEVKFGDIENIHYMRTSFKELTEGLQDYSISKNKEALNKWISTIESILKGATYVRDQILQGDSVIINCSDGWDRTPQIVSLTKILLDPYYRTIEGFRILIMYEWNGFGHKFKSRQHYSNNKESSPVFIQFVDCVN